MLKYVAPRSAVEACLPTESQFQQNSPPTPAASSPELNTEAYTQLRYVTVTRMRQYYYGTHCVSIVITKPHSAPQHQILRPPKHKRFRARTLVPRNIASYEVPLAIQCSEPGASQEHANSSKPTMRPTTSGKTASQATATQQQVQSWAGRQHARLCPSERGPSLSVSRTSRPKTARLEHTIPACVLDYTIINMVKKTNSTRVPAHLNARLPLPSPVPRGSRQRV